MKVCFCTAEEYDEEDGPIVADLWKPDLPSDYMVSHCEHIFYMVEWEEKVYCNGKLQHLFWHGEDLPPDEQIDAADKDGDYFMIVWEEDE